MSELFAKYDIPAPRYTSYPTVPYWEEAPDASTWVQHLRDSLKSADSAWSMYIHIPYCETLCTFCGCNNIITKDHGRESSYVDLLLKEWELYSALVPEFSDREIKNLHLGGGTPTFLSAENLKNLLSPILGRVNKGPHFEASIEVDPRRTTVRQLEVLRELGFNRVSMGVQDFHPEVQRLVNRIQPFEITQKLTEEARQLGYASVNFDLIYGLARQTPETMKICIEKTLELSPDRIALYSFALVPWIKPAQRLFKDEDLPVGAEKRALYELSREMLLAAGYVEVGMDHFAKPSEALALAQKNKKLHRNFMGYTDQLSQVLLGLGVSSISESLYSFHQNEKLLPQYQMQIEKNSIATHRGHILTESDQKHRKQILHFMTQGEVELENQQLSEVREFLKEMFQDDLVRLSGTQLSITTKGKPFLRNACLFFDERLKRSKPSTQVFSKSI